jgi:hypothetical protein
MVSSCARASGVRCFSLGAVAAISPTVTPETEQERNCALDSEPVCVDPRQMEAVPQRHRVEEERTPRMS